jgi:hypothetical protein
LSKQHQDEDLVVTLLENIRQVFDAHKPSGIASADLVAALYEMEDAPWAEWRGVHDDQQPRRLSQAEMATLLRPFGIKPKSLWPPGPRVAGTHCRRGYLRKDLEPAWLAYVDTEAAADADRYDVSLPPLRAV